jgi:uroporphyrinogen III methyltransferase/synthase
VKLRGRMNWFERRPLFAQTIIVTRTRDQASELTDQLTAFGANVLEAPTIELAPASDQAGVTNALNAGPWDWIIFTSKTGVASTKKKLFEAGMDARALGNARIAVVGEATAAAVREELCLRVDLCPREFVAEALADAFEAANEIKGRRFLLLRAEIARQVLIDRLHHAGAAAVLDVAIYQTRPSGSLPPEVTDALTAGKVDWITFTSSSTARNFTALMGDDYAKKMHGIKLASIGPVTSTTLRELQLAPTVESDPHTIAGLVDAIGRFHGAGV